MNKSQHQPAVQIKPRQLAIKPNTAAHPQIATPAAASPHLIPSPPISTSKSIPSPAARMMTNTTSTSATITPGSSPSTATAASPAAIGKLSGPSISAAALASLYSQFARQNPGAAASAAFMPNALPLFAIGADGKPVCITPNALLSPAAAAAATGQVSWASVLASHAHLFQPISKPADLLSSQTASASANMPPSPALEPIGSLRSAAALPTTDGTRKKRRIASANGQSKTTVMPSPELSPKKTTRLSNIAPKSSPLHCSNTPISSAAPQPNNIILFETADPSSDRTSSSPPSLSPASSASSSPVATSSSSPSPPSSTVKQQPKKKMTKRRLKVKNPALFATIDEMCAERIVGRSLMNNTQIQETISQLNSTIIELMASPGGQKTRMILTKLRRIRAKFMNKLKFKRDFDIDQRIIQYLKDDQLTPIIPRTLANMGEDHCETTIPQTAQSDAIMEEEDYDDSPIPYKISFKRKLLGCDSHTHILDTQPTVSSFSGRKLEQFLWRDYETKSEMMKTFDTIRSRSSNPSPTGNHPTSIDYTYLRSHHVAEVNKLLCRLFWPQIDITSDLQSPDHAIIVLYGRRIIGCGIVDVGPTRSYITYLAVDYGWRGCGIASTLMYLLTRMYRKDVLLHVQPTNWNAMRVYQKWGFKGESYLVGFYDRYVPWSEGEGPGDWSNRGSRNALYMRLRQS